MLEISSEGKSVGAFDSRSLEGWKQRIIVSTLLTRVVGGGAGLISKHRKALGVGVTAASVAANFAIVTGCYCSARDAQASEPDDLINSMVGGLASGGILGILQGGQLGAAKYAILFAAAGTAVDFTTVQLRPYFQSFTKGLTRIRDGKSTWSLPEWSPI